jgi:hypothetical protein
MDLSPGQKKAVFALVVVVLAALGYWLILPRVSHSSAQAKPTSNPSTPSPTESVPSPPPSPAGRAVTATPTATGSVNIYSWLPFTADGLTAAASVTQQFLVDYDTYSYTESAQDYVGKMGNLVTGQLATTLKGLYSSPGVAKVRNDQKQTSTGTAQVSSLRSFGPSSLTFVVTANQHLVTAKGTSNGTAQYAITVTGSGTSWQVDNIELSSTGQF